jgi:hypothetical protein
MSKDPGAEYVAGALQLARVSAQIEAALGQAEVLLKMINTIHDTDNALAPELLKAVEKIEGLGEHLSNAHTVACAQLDVLGERLNQERNDAEA